MWRIWEAASRAEFSRRGPDKLEGDLLGKCLVPGTDVGLRRPDSQAAAPPRSHLPSIPLQSRAPAQACILDEAGPLQASPSPLLPSSTPWEVAGIKKGKG